MSFYVTSPFGRTMRRRMWDMMDREMPAVENEVVFPVDVKAEADDFVITAMLPGVKAEDLNIQVVNETVTLQGSIQPGDAESEMFLLHELPAGRFCRTLSLPDPLDSEKAEAHLQDGILTLRVPKAETARPKTIKISNN